MILAFSLFLITLLCVIIQPRGLQIGTSAIIGAGVATVIAQIACYDNKLPQGSPCSPVITNLISHILDIQLAALAKANSCVYSRYADDITFSTRERVFPSDIMSIEAGEYIVGRKLRGIIKRAGFSLNEKKTRIQFKDSRQDVTGLVVNKKPNVKKEYWRTIKSQCHSLFKNGTFTTKRGNDIVEGNISELEGHLNFIDHIDFYNLFTIDELAAVYTAAKENVYLQIFLDKIKVSKKIVMNDPDVITGLGLLVQMTILTDERRQAILAS